jgi:hypothetical protein
MLFDRMRGMEKKQWWWLAVLILGWTVVRFVIGGPEDDWICEGGEWVRHGWPRDSRPEGECKDGPFFKSLSPKQKQEWRRISGIIIGQGRVFVMIC